MWNTEEKPEDMPLEEWLWITGQSTTKRGNYDGESREEPRESYY